MVSGLNILHWTTSKEAHPRERLVLLLPAVLVFLCLGLWPSKSALLQEEIFQSRLCLTPAGFAHGLWELILVLSSLPSPLPRSSIKYSFNHGCDLKSHPLICSKDSPELDPVPWPPRAELVLLSTPVTLARSLTKDPQGQQTKGNQLLLGTAPCKPARLWINQGGM